MALRTSKTGSSILCRTFSWLYTKQTVPFSQGFPRGNMNQKATYPFEEIIASTFGKASFRYLESTNSGSSHNLFLRKNGDNITGKEDFRMNLTECAETRSTTLGECFLAWRGALVCSLSRDSAQLQQQRTFVQLKTKLNVADNSGAKVVECIKVMNKTRGARLGDKIIASVKEVVGRGKVKKGEVVYCVIVRARMQRGRCDGSEVRFDDNAVVLINKQGEPIGTRIMGPVCHELREKKMVKVLSLSEHVA